MIVLGKNGGDRRSDEFQVDNCQLETPKQRGASAVEGLKLVTLQLALSACDGPTKVG